MSTAIELVCVVGYTGKFKSTLVHHPIETNIIVYPIGSLLVITDVKDSNKQDFLRNGHDENISLVKISISGKLIISAQLPSRRSKGNYSSVCIWDFYKRKLLHRIKAHQSICSGISLSHDDQFLATIGQKKLYLWDLADGASYSGGLPLRGSGKFVNFVAAKSNFNAKRPIYTLVYGDNKVCKCKWVYEIKKLNFKLVEEDFKLPGRMSGMKRTFTTAVVDSKGENCFVGTRLGEVMIFSVDYSTFQTSLLVCANGVFSLAIHKSSASNVYVGGGDGSVKIISNSSSNWRIVKEVKLSGMVTSLSHSINGGFVYTGTEAGKVLQIDSKTLNVSAVISQAHVNSVTTSSFREDSEVFCTTSDDGYVFVWDLSSFEILAKYTAVGKPTVATYFEKEKIVIGWSDGSIRLWDEKNNKILWKVINAHRGAVTCIVFNKLFICTGGADGGIRLWRAKSRELVGQFSEHSNAITGLIIDRKFSNILHSCSSDKNVFTHDLKTNRRVSYHTPSPDSLKSITQKTDGELEIITSSSNGRVRFWDIDYKDAVEGFNDESKLSVNAVEISPKSGKFLAYGGNDAILKIYSLKDKKIISEGIGHSSPILSLKWSPDEKQIVTTSIDASVCVWNFYQ